MILRRETNSRVNKRFSAMKFQLEESNGSGWFISVLLLSGNKFSGSFWFNMGWMFHWWMDILDKLTSEWRTSNGHSSLDDSNSHPRSPLRLLGQGFSFHEDSSTENKDSILPPTGRRIPASSRIMTEILGTLFYFKWDPTRERRNFQSERKTFPSPRANSKAKEASECMRLLKQRAEYELYADVILVGPSPTPHRWLCHWVL